MAAAAIAKRLKRMGNITIRLAPAVVDSVGCATDPAASKRRDHAAFGGYPQGFETRAGGKVSPSRSISSQPRLLTLLLWRYRGRPAATHVIPGRAFFGANPEIQR
jgi:hypothetical protein